MITHKIEKKPINAYTAPTPVHTHSNWKYRGRGGLFATKVSCQEDLDNYIKSKPWLKPGVVLKYKNSTASGPYSLHVVVGLETQYSKMEKPEVGWNSGPRIARLCSMNLTENIQTKLIESSWVRVIDVEDMEPAGHDEIVIWIDDHLQNYFERWKQQEGLSFGDEPKAGSPY